MSQPILESSTLGLVDWVSAASILLGGVAVSIVVRRAVIGVLRRGTTMETMSERLLGRIVQIVVVLVAMSYALTVLDVRIGPLLGALGIGGVAVALALQETLRNLFAGIILHAQRPLRLGEEVMTGEVQGVVTDITSRAVTIRSNSGPIVFVPNSLLLDREIVNLVRLGRRRTTLTVGVAYGTDLEVAREVLRGATAGAAGVLSDPPTRVMAAEFADSSIDFHVDFWHSPLEVERRVACGNVIAATHRALGDAGITIPFPQRTLWSGVSLDEPRAAPGGRASDGVAPEGRAPDGVAPPHGRPSSAEPPWNRRGV